jgi:hypothetical protein
MQEKVGGTKGFQAARAIKYQLPDRREHEDPLKGGWRAIRLLSLPGEQILQQFSQHFYRARAHILFCLIEEKNDADDDDAFTFFCSAAWCTREGPPPNFDASVCGCYGFNLLGNLLCAATQPKVNCFPFPAAGKTMRRGLNESTKSDKLAHDSNVCPQHQCGQQEQHPIFSFQESCSYFTNFWRTRNNLRQK